MTNDKNLTFKQIKDNAMGENEMQSLNNLLISFKLKGYKILRNYNYKTRKYFVFDSNGDSITGSWGYNEINHFLLGYGKAFTKNNN
jgi:hypothetical protein